MRAGLPVVLVVLAGCSTPPLAPGSLVFFMEVDGVPQLMAASPDGGARQLTAPGLAHLPMGASATGVLVLQTGLDGGAREGTLLELGMGAPVVLRSKVAQARRANRVGRDEVVVVSGRDAFSELYLERAGAPAKRLTENVEGNFDATPSPDGRTIVFASSRDGSLELYRMNADGSEQRRLTTSEGDDLLPKFSPDGAWVAFVSARSGRDRVWLMRPDGREQHAATPPVKATGAGPEAFERDAEWSPDGKFLAFASRVEGEPQARVAVIDVASGTRTWVSPPALDADAPSWSLDGQQLTFVAVESETSTQIFTVERDGRGLRRWSVGAARRWFPRFVRSP